MSARFRPPSDLRFIERRIARLEHADHHDAQLPLEPLRARLSRVDTLLELGEADEAFRQLDLVVDTLLQHDSLDARTLLVLTLARRVRLSLDSEERFPLVLADVDRALELLQDDTLLHAHPEFPELQAELYTHRGHLFVLLDHPGAADALHRAIELADTLPPSARPLLALARRELALLLAQRDPTHALELLEQARGALERSTRSHDTDDALLNSTTAEVLAALGRVDDALELLDGDEPWRLNQRATLLEQLGRLEDAARTGLLLIERLQNDLDPRNPNSALPLAESLLAQAERIAEDDRAPLLHRAIQLLDPFARLRPAARLLCRALELQAASSEPEDAHQALRERAVLLQDMLRDDDLPTERLELVRTFLLDGDTLLRLERPAAARRSYTWAVDQLDAWPQPLHPAVPTLRPLALNALSHAWAACGSWLRAAEVADLAADSIPPQPPPPAWSDFGELLLFRSIAHLSVGQPETAVQLLEHDLELLSSHLSPPADDADAHDAQDADAEVERTDDAEVEDADTDDAQDAEDADAEDPNVEDTNAEDPDAEDADVEDADVEDAGEELGAMLLRDAIANLCVLRAEILVDHLDAVDAASDSYDRAVQVVAGPSQLDILGAKAAMLAERGRSQPALELLDQCAQAWAHLPEDAASTSAIFVHIFRAHALTDLERPSEALDALLDAERALDADPADDPSERLRQLATRSLLLHRRGEAIFAIGHPLLAADELTRSIDLDRELLEEDGEPSYEASLHLPHVLLRRAHCWIAAENHTPRAREDLKEARRRFSALVRDEHRPEHQRSLRDVQDLQRRLT